jgi:two-component system CheB/CheR fusion protein
MEQVFFNLLKNALEAMKDGGSINIDIATDDGDVSVAFRDSGYGMNAEQLAHLFEPYRTTKEHGTGLGLMISARIVREHGGTISAESKVGEGTTFTVKLPRLERRVRALK